MTTDTQQQYHKLSIALHWLMFLLMVAVYACIELRELYPKGSDLREGLKAWHFTLGLTVLALVVIRIGARIKYLAPEISPAPVNWQRYSAKLAHVFLYAMMFCLPIAGWVMLSAAGKPIPFWGFELPALIDENKDLAKQIKQVHATIGELGYYVIGLHAFAALYHHYFLKDNTLVRMLPKR